MAALSLGVGINLFAFQSRHAGDLRSEHPAKLAAGGPEDKSDRKSERSPSRSGALLQRSDAATVQALQRELKLAGFYPGQIDGRASYLTHAAIFAYEDRYGLPLSAEPTQAILKTLIVGTSAPATRGNRAPGIVAGSAAERLVRDIKIKLNDLGYATGAADSRLTPQLIRAIRAFEADSGLRPTGQISAGLLMHIYRSTAAFRPRRG